MHKGSCLCQRVQYELTVEPGYFGYCHCISCRKASGSAHAANAPIGRANFRLLTGGEVLREFESSPGMFRAFRTNCGSPIYAYRAENPDYIGIRLGTLDTPFAKQPLGHKFVAEKATWEPIDDGLPQFSRQALFLRPPKDGDV